MIKYFYNKIIHILLICGVIITMFSLFGCDYKTKAEREKEEIFTIANSIVQSIALKNTDEFSSHFTKEASATYDFKDGINYTFNIFTGNIKSIEDRSSRVRDSFDSGMHTKTALARYTIITDTNEYVLSFVYYLKDEKNNNQSEIPKLKLSLSNENIDWSNHNFAWKYSQEGIYNPEWDNTVVQTNY